MLKVKFSLSNFNRSNLTLVIIVINKKVKMGVHNHNIQKGKVKNDNYNIQKVYTKLQNAYEFKIIIYKKVK